MYMDLFLYVILIVVFHVIISAVMAEIAFRMYDNKGLWLAFFALLPVISIPAFFLIVWRNNVKKRNTILGADLTGRDVRRCSPDVGLKGQSVTPFADGGIQNPFDDSLMFGQNIENHPFPEILKFTDTASVTPFASTGSDPLFTTGHDDAHGFEIDESESCSILAEIRDKKIDDLLEWKLWGQALKLAKNLHADAEKEGDWKSIELYKAYMTMLNRKIRML